MTKKFIIIYTLLHVNCDSQIADYFFPGLTKSTRDLSAELSKNPVLNLATFTYGNSLANAVDVFTQLPLALASTVGPLNLLQPISTSNNVEYIDKIVADFNAGKSNEDARMDIEGLVTKYGYRIEKHRVVTQDGYELTLFRIPNNGTAVFLMHGVLGSADDFVIPGPESGIAYLLAKKGCDIWMGNARGNKYSRRHTRFKTAEAKFWDFSFHEIGVYDLPAMIDYVLEKIDQMTIRYVGHSQGTTSFFVMTSERPEYNQKLSVMVALSPVAFMSKVRSPVVRLLAPGTHVLSGFFKSIGMYEFLPDNNVIRVLKLFVCGTGPLAEILCSNSIFLVTGFDLGQLNVTNLPVLLGHLPAGASTKQLVHYGQGVMSGDFRQFDYGSAENLRRYGVETPPSYDLNNIVTPISLFYSDADWLAQPEDVRKLYDKLNSVFDVYKVPYEQFNHIDFVFAKDLKSLIFRRLKKLLIK